MLALSRGQERIRAIQCPAPAAHDRKGAFRIGDPDIVSGIKRCPVDAQQVGWAPVTGSCPLIGLRWGYRV